MGQFLSQLRLLPEFLSDGGIGLGADAPASAILALASTTRGFLLPRMTTAQRDAIASPETGLHVYNTTTGALNFYNGSAWGSASVPGIADSSLSPDTSQFGTLGRNGLAVAASMSDLSSSLPSGTGTYHGVLSVLTAGQTSGTTPTGWLSRVAALWGQMTVPATNVLSPSPITYVGVNAFVFNRKAASTDHFIGGVFSATNYEDTPDADYYGGYSEISTIGAGNRSRDVIGHISDISHSQTGVGRDVVNYRCLIRNNIGSITTSTGIEVCAPGGAGAVTGYNRGIWVKTQAGKGDTGKHAIYCDDGPSGIDTLGGLFGVRGAIGSPSSFTLTPDATSWGAAGKHGLSVNETMAGFSSANTGVATYQGILSVLTAGQTSGTVPAAWLGRASALWGQLTVPATNVLSPSPITYSGANCYVFNRKADSTDNFIGLVSSIHNFADTPSADYYGAYAEISTTGASNRSRDLSGHLSSVAHSQSGVARTLWNYRALNRDNTGNVTTSIGLELCAPGGAGSVTGINYGLWVRSQAGKGSTAKYAIYCDDGPTYINTKGQVVATSFVGTPVDLTDAATIATNAALGQLFRVTIATGRTLGAPTNPTDGQRATWAVTNSSGGAVTLALASGAGGFAFGSDITALSDIAAGKTDYIGAIYNSGANRWRVVAYTKGY